MDSLPRLKWITLSVFTAASIPKCFTNISSKLCSDSKLQDLETWAAERFPAAEATSGQIVHVSVINATTCLSKKNPLLLCCLRARTSWTSREASSPQSGLPGYGPPSPPPQDVATSETLKRCQIISAQRPRRFKWSPGWINDWWKLVPVSSAVLAAVELQPPPAVGFSGTSSRLHFVLQMWGERAVAASRH